METVDEYARSVRHRAHMDGKDRHSQNGEELSILYGMAENEALGELCSTLEEVSEVSRTGPARY